MSTQFRTHDGSSSTPAGARDPAEQVARVAADRREALLHLHRFRLRYADLEDCFSQAAFELVVQARKGRKFLSRRHIENSLQQRFLARVADRRRAIAGRSPIQAALEEAAPLGATGRSPEVPDDRSDPERIVLAREELRLLRASASALTPDQRLVLAAQLSVESDREWLRAQRQWTPERYRKLAERARVRLRSAMSAQAGVTSSPAGRSQQQGPSL